MVIKKNIFCFLIFSVFSFIANAQFTPIYNFNGATDGDSPRGSLISDGTFLYGMTYDGGIHNLGTIFKVKPDGTNYSILLDFSGISNGANPISSLFYDGTFLYGMTYRGGLNDYGVIFKINTDGSGYSKYWDFAGSIYGKFPCGALISDGAFLYGTTYYGGAYNFGEIFKIKLDGTGFTDMHDFNGNGNVKPYCTLFYDGIFLYGTTEPVGTIFRIKTDGTDYFVLHHFNSLTEGADLFSGLISDGTYLYGTADDDGPNYASGTIYKIRTTGTDFSVLHVFESAVTHVNGDHPTQGLVLHGSFLYGVANGGTDTAGIMFKIKTDGTEFTKLHDFSHYDSIGTAPAGPLLVEGNILYGMTAAGGFNNRGAIYKYDIGSDETPSDFYLYPNPSNGFFNFNSVLTEGEVLIYNVLGEIIFQVEINNQLSSIDLSKKPAGVYFITIKTKEKSLTQKIIISH